MGVIFFTLPLYFYQGSCHNESKYIDKRRQRMNKKMIAPLVIGVIIALYFLLWITMIFQVEVDTFFAFLIGLPFIALLFLWIYIVKERIDEIRSGEEDDLSKY